MSPKVKIIVTMLSFISLVGVASTTLAQEEYVQFWTLDGSQGNADIPGVTVKIYRKVDGWDEVASGVSDQKGGIKFGIPPLERGVTYRYIATKDGYSMEMNDFDVPVEGIRIENVIMYPTNACMPCAVGGIAAPIEKFAVDEVGLSAPYIALVSTIIVATATTAIYVKRIKRRKKKQ